jgi:release factor glutamine methyltransferase
LPGRIAHEPTAYIVGRREFWGLDFAVTPAVLIPRPETELIVEEALDIVRTSAIDAPVIADIGTGSGNLAISIAHSIASARVTATDVSADALAVARRNAHTTTSSAASHL